MQYYYRCEIWANAEILQQKPAPLGSASISHHITIRPRLQLLIDVITHFSNSETRNLVWILNLKFPYKSQRDSEHYFALMWCYALVPNRAGLTAMMYGVSLTTRFLEGGFKCFYLQKLRLNKNFLLDLYHSILSHRVLLIFTLWKYSKGLIVALVWKHSTCNAEIWHASQFVNKMYIF